MTSGRKTRRVSSEKGPASPLVAVLAAAAGGILIDRHWPLPLPLWLTAAAAAWFLWHRCWRAGFEVRAAILLLASVAGVFAAWHHYAWNRYPRTAIAAYAREAGEPACVEAVACESVRRLPPPPDTPLRALPAGERTRVTVEVLRIRDGAQWRAASGRVLATVDGALGGIRAGDRLRIVGQLSAPGAQRNPGEFDFAADARASRRQARLWCNQPECVAIATPGSRFNLLRPLGQVREYGDRMFARYVGRERSGLAAALVVGLREQLDAQRGEAFLEAGMMHVLAISGLHVGVLALVLFGVLRMGFVPRGAALAGIVALVAFYAVLTDAGTPVVRAAVMVAIICVSIYLGRPAMHFNSIAAAALIVLAINPSDLFRVGPQLSFLAVAVIAWVHPRLVNAGADEDPLDRLIRLSRPWPVRAARRMGVGLRRALLLSAAIWLAAAPLVAARFHVISPAAILLNVLFAIPVAAALLSGFGVMLLGWIAPPLAMVCGFICNSSLAIMDWLVEMSRQAPGSHYWLPGPEAWWLWGFYGGMCAILAAWRWRPLPARWRLALAAGWLAVGVGASWYDRGGERLVCTFVSVGHGSATVIELPGGETMIYDAGQLGAPETGARALAGTLWSRGITHLDAVVISHADVDHFNAIPALLEKFSVGAIYISTVMLESESPAVLLMVDAIRRHDIPLREVSAGNRLGNGGGVELEFLHPTRQGVIGSDNANSLVLSIEYAGRRILLTGDLEGRGLDQLLAEEPLDCDVVAAPHHGSARSNPPGFAAWSTPEWVVVSGGLGRESEEVERAFTDAGARVLHTARDGAVTATIDRSGVTVATHRRASADASR